MIGEQLRLATALAHGIPGVTLVLRTLGGSEVIVAAHRLDAHLDPCALRAAVLAAPTPGGVAFADTIAAAEVRLGLQDLGGGLYAKQAAEGEQRWFATTLDHVVLADLLDNCPLDVPDESMCAGVRPDAELGATLVCVTANHPSVGRHLDAVASWALAVCMVEELLRAGRREVHR